MDARVSQPCTLDSRFSSPNLTHSDAVGGLLATGVGVGVFLDPKLLTLNRRHLGVVGSLLTAGVGIKMSAHVLDLLFQSRSCAPGGTFL